MSNDTAALEAVGYQVHQGTPADGELAGRWWWTLFQPGWGECEASPRDFGTADEAWADAAKAHAADPLPTIH